MADLIVTGGEFITMDSARPRAQEMLVSDGRVQALGSPGQLRSQHPQARVLDIEGGTALPGFTDSHIHVRDWALSRLSLPLQQAQSREQLLGMVSGQAASRPGAVVGRGFLETAWPDERLPTRDELDAAASGIPAVLYRRDMHMALANSAALQAAHISELSPDPPGGSLGRDARGGLTGVLLEEAMNLVAPVAEGLDGDQLARAMAEACGDLLGRGITGVHDFRVMGGVDGPSAWRAWQIMAARGELPLRAWVNVPARSLPALVDIGLRTGMGGDRLRLGHLKIFMDGSMGSGTAWMHEPCTPDWKGVCVTDLGQLARTVGQAHGAGIAVAVHAIGDRANQEIMRVLVDLSQAHGQDAQSAPPVAPHRVEHVQVADQATVAGLAQSGAVASVQPQEILSDIDVHERLLGREGSERAHALGDLQAAGVPLAFGSDCPVAEPLPLAQLRAAVTRCPREPGSRSWKPGQCLTLDSALRALTMGPALACGRSHELGSLSPGKWADLVVLDQDPYKVEPDILDRLQVRLTMVAGRVAFRA